MDKVNTYLDKLTDLAVTYVPKLVLAIVVLLVGSFIIKRVVKLSAKIFEKRKFDKALKSFLLSMIKVALWVLLVITVAGMVGIETTSFVAVLGAAGLAVGLALQGSLANFAGGVLILIFRPFRIDDLVEMQGFLGIVDSISIFHTELKTLDNRVVILPNGAVANGAITNITREDLRRVDMEFGIGYDDDIDKAKALMAEILNADKRVLKQPAEPFIALSSLGDSSVNFAVRVWVNKDDYWGVYFDTHEKVKKLFDQKGVSIPFPQRDVHLYTEKA